MAAGKIACDIAMTVLSIAAAAQNNPAKPAFGDENQQLIGDGHGTSVCLVKPSACNDEEALYHLQAAAKQTGRFSLQGDKTVDGTTVIMGPWTASTIASKSSCIATSKKASISPLAKMSFMTTCM
jgi:hypothetical protein